MADPYLRIWVKDENLILKMESYSLTKRLMRTAVFRIMSRSAARSSRV